MAIEEAMLVEMFKTQARMEVKLDQLISDSQMENMEDMMEEESKKGHHAEMDGSTESMLGEFTPDLSTLFSVC